MENTHNLEEWFAGAPDEVREATERLMEEVDYLRESQVIYPAQDDILNALSYTAPRDVRVVILGQDPYHGPHQAMGLSFSVPKGEKLPPSLRNIYKEMAADLGCAMATNGDLTSWAKQGVLLLNTTLTVREHEANSHSKLGWQVLTTYVVQRCFELEQPVVFLAWGRHAVQLVRACKENQDNQDNQEGQAPLAPKFILESTHPSPLSANKQGGELQAFMGSKPFSRANALLEANGSVAVDWTSVISQP